MDQDVNILVELNLQSLTIAFILGTKCPSCFWWICFNSSIIQISSELGEDLFCWKTLCHVPVGFFPSKMCPSFIIANICIGDSFVGKRHWNDSTIGKNIFYLTTLQEFLAHGLSNVIPSFFFCIPSAAAMGRTALLYSTGAKTQVMSLKNTGCEKHRLRVKYVRELKLWFCSLQFVLIYPLYFPSLPFPLFWICLCPVIFNNLHEISSDQRCLPRKDNASIY